MSLFGKNNKTKLPFVSMERLIEETSKNTLPTILDTLSRSGSDIAEIDIKTNVIAINYELARYELYKYNEKNAVEEVINDLYEGLQYLVNVSIEYKNKFDETVRRVQNVSKEIFNVKHLAAPKEKFIYRLLLEQLSIREDNVPSEIIPELVFYARSWADNMTNIATTYSIDTSDDGRKNDTIDFKF